MKKILVFLLTLILFSCSENEITISKEEYDSLKGVKPEVIHSRPFKFKKSELSENHKWFISEGEDEHEYLHNEGYNTFVLIHYPECKKCTNHE